MKLKYSISSFIVIISLLLLFVYYYMFTHAYEVEQYAEIEEEIHIEEIVLSNSDEVISEGYYLREVEGYVVVYLYDNTTIFHETDIQVSSLSETLQAEIQGGKYIESEQALYAFLENYSS